MARPPKRNEVGRPHAVDAEGVVTINLLDFDGYLIVGTGNSRFDTKWDFLHEGAVRAYNDGRNILGVAVTDFEGPLGALSRGDVISLNYTSRVRPARIDQVVVFENTEGKYLALRVTAVRALSDTDISVTFAYRVLAYENPDDIDALSLDEPLPDLGEVSYLLTEEGDFITDDQGNRLILEGTPKALPEQLVFDLYAPYRPEDLAEAATSARSRVSALLEASAVQSEDAYSTLGHNHPPPDMLTSVEARREVIESLDILAALDATDKSNREAAIRAGKVLLRTAGQIASWIWAKVDKAADSFAEAIGEKAALGATIVAGWYLVGGDLARLADMVAKAFLGS